MALENIQCPHCGEWTQLVLKEEIEIIGIKETQPNLLKKVMGEDRKVEQCNKCENKFWIEYN